MARLDGFGTKKFFSVIREDVDLKELEVWLAENIGDGEEPVDVEFVLDEDGTCYNYTYVYRWAWMQSDKILHNMLPSRLVGFLKEEDAIHCQMIFG